MTLGNSRSAKPARLARQRHRPSFLIVTGFFLAGNTNVEALHVNQASSSVKAPGKVVRLEIKVQPKKYGAPEGTLAVVAHIEPGYHINSSRPRSEFLVPTAVRFQLNPELQMGIVDYPRGTDKKFPFSENRLSVYEGEIRIRVPYQVIGGRREKPVLLRGEFHYQACTEKACLLPQYETFEVPIQ